jgi:hypothetical protein
MNISVKTERKLPIVLRSYTFTPAPELDPVGDLSKLIFYVMLGVFVFNLIVVISLLI